ncbi:MAG TPA: hypothetical protein VMO54_00875, partial [Steroidobacteraceae bacterium]|nr:hypothetical protein [Steroidobacteraceae bacterium]
TVCERREVAGTDVAWDQPAKILPLEAAVREAILRIEREFEASLRRLESCAAHLPSRVRSLIWILSSLPVMAEHGLAVADEQDVKRELASRLPQLDGAGGLALAATG